MISIISGCTAFTKVSNNHTDTASSNIIVTEEFARHDFPYKSRYVEVLDSKMHYVDTGGDKEPILMIHGQPTWSYLWRNVIPELEKEHRVIAIDLIGFGKSDKPDIKYTIEDHALYLEGFIEQLKLKDITLVVHDWGGVLGFDYASRNPENIKSFAFMETVIPTKQTLTGLVKDQNIEELQGFAKILAMLSTPGVGEKMIFEDNMFIEQILPSSIMRKVSNDEMNAYREPFANGKNRLPMLQFPREIGIFGDASDYVLNARKSIQNYLKTTDVPSLLLTFSPGALVTQNKIDWVKENMKNATVKQIGRGVHYVQEDHPEAIGKSINNWLKRK